jgi:hypothetical protein
MKAIAICVACLFLQGCWFVFIPGSLISAVGDKLGGYEGNMCVASTAKVGDKVRMPDGRTGTVRKLEGESTRCTQTYIPIRAVVDLDVV